jgi:diaminopimelate epimerase
VKAHGTGNHFVLLPDRGDALTLDAPLARSLCDERTGLRGDGVIRLGAPRDPEHADVFMDYRNRDGSLAETCGNGVRCVAKHVLDDGWVPGDRVRVDTRAGVRAVDVVARHGDGRVAEVCVAMGVPVVGDPVDLDISPLADPPATGAVLGDADAAVATAEHRLLRLTTVALGNPHAVAVVDDVHRAPLARWARLASEHHAFPSGVNVEVLAAAGPDVIEGRIHERGVGETAASGTGAAAIAVTACHLGLAGSPVTVRLPGGELVCEWRDDDLQLTGPAETVAAGHLDPAWLAARDVADPRPAPTAS